MSSGATLTARLGDFVAGLPSDSIPLEARTRARTAIIDAVGCTLAGSGTPAGLMITKHVASQGGQAQSSVLGTNLQAPAGLAALANGTAGHALDYDDFLMRMAHPSVVLLPAILAAGERDGRSGRELVEAYVIGFEVTGRLCRHLNPAHYARGWHATSTIGVLGAAAAAARLARLPAEQVRTAVGIAASNAAGVRKNFGSMVKPLHAGTAAAAGLLAADLAAAGFTADLDILDGPRNFLEVYAGAGAHADPGGLFAPGEPFELVETGIALKRFACCGAIHATADAVLTIREQHPEVAWIDAVRTIECRVNRMSPDILIHHRAESPDEGKFCLEYSVAAALLDGALGFAQYTPERIVDPAVQTLSSRVKVVVDPDMAVHYTSFPGAVEIELSDGRRLRSSVHSQKGNPDNPLSAADVEAKFMECAEPVLGATGTRSALDLLNSLEDIADLRRVGVALRPLAAQAGAARGSPR